jgi:hypothetical protein
MKGKSTFTTSELVRIRTLLRLKEGADRRKQMKLRAQIRRLGFYISDFGSRAPEHFTESDLDLMLRAGRIVERAE